MNRADLLEEIRKAYQGLSIADSDEAGDIHYLIARIDSLEAQLKEAREALFRIGGMCGTPDAAEGCRNILKVSKALIEKWKD